MFPAETEWKYSNFGLTLAGEIVAAVSGEAWAQYVESRILKPLGMKTTTPIPASNLTSLGCRVRAARAGARATLSPSWIFKQKGLQAVWPRRLKIWRGLHPFSFAMVRPVGRKS